MKFIDSDVSQNQLWVLDYIYEVGVASSSEIWGNTDIKKINILVDNEFIKCIHTIAGNYYYLCQVGFDIMNSIKTYKDYNYVDYIERTQKKIGELLIDEFKNEMKILEANYPGVFKAFSMPCVRESVKPLYSLKIGDVIYLIEAEESMRSEFMYTRKFREYAKQFKMLKKLGEFLPHEIILLKGNGSKKNRTISSNEQQDFKYIFTIYQQELGDLSNVVRLLYLTPFEFRKRKELLLYNEKYELDVIEELHRKINDVIDPSYLTVFEDIDELTLLQLKEENRAEVFVWNHRQALKVYIENKNLYILLQRCEGFDSKPWIKGLKLFKAFSEEFPNSKVVCYFQMTVFEPYFNELQLLSCDDDLKNYYHSMYLIDLREGLKFESSTWNYRSIWNLIKEMKRLVHEIN